MATQRQTLATYAITLVCHNRHRHFQRAANADLFLATLFRYRGAGRFLLHGFVVMPDHIHVLLTPAIDQSTARIIQLLKGGYSHAAKSPSPIWQPGHHEHRIRDAADYASQLSYIAANPHRKQLAEYPYVHTRHPAQLDPTATHSASAEPSPQSAAPLAG